MLNCPASESSRGAVVDGPGDFGPRLALRGRVAGSRGRLRLFLPKEPSCRYPHGLLYAVRRVQRFLGRRIRCRASNSSSRSSTIYEYAHGGTSPIATLSDPDFAWGCAVDPLTGNLAVSGGISVAIYQHASGAPTIYSNSEFHFFYCGYDDRGNLYLSSNDYRYADRAQLVRLASGSNQFEQVDLSRKVYTGQVLPSVQWDGNHMTISSDIGREPISIYRLRISGSAGTVVGTTTIRSQKNVYSGQMWIQGSTFLGAGNDPGDRGQNFSSGAILKAALRTVRYATWGLEG